MIKYKIVNGYLNPYGSAVDNIEEIIQGKLDAGYKLHGNLIHIRDNEYSQAMIYKYKEKTKINK